MDGKIEIYFLLRFREGRQFADLSIRDYAFLYSYRTHFVMYIGSSLSHGSKPDYLCEATIYTVRGTSCRIVLDELRVKSS